MAVPLVATFGCFVILELSYQTAIGTTGKKINVQKYDDYTFEGVLTKAKEECSYMSLVNDTLVRDRALYAIKEKIAEKKLKEFYEQKEVEKQKAKEFYANLEKQSRRRVLEGSHPPGLSPSKPGPFPPRPGPFFSKPEPLSPKPGPLSPRPGPFSSGPGPFFPKPGPFSPKSEPFFPKPEPFSPQAGPFSPKPEPFSPQAGPFSPRPEPFSPQARPFSPRPGPFPPQSPHPPFRRFNKRSTEWSARRRKTSSSFSEVSFADHNNCSSRCLFARMEMVDASGFPDESLMTKLIDDKVINKRVRLVKTNRVKSCFKKMEEVAFDDSCVFSSRLFDCLDLGESLWSGLR